MAGFEERARSEPRIRISIAAEIDTADKAVRNRQRALTSHIAVISKIICIS